MEWVYLQHGDTGGATRVPDEPGVVEWHEAHGWVRAQDPELAPPAEAADKPAMKATAKKAARVPADEKDEG